MTKLRCHIQVAALSILGLSACSWEQVVLPDPCHPETYNDIACQDAVKNHGYYSRGVFVYGNYPDPYLTYFQRYQDFTSKGGVPHEVPLWAYAAPVTGGCPLARRRSRRR
jgi:hypothetical protein